MKATFEEIDILTCPKCGGKFQDDWSMPAEYKGLRFEPGFVEHAGGKFALKGTQLWYMELLVRADGKVVTKRAIDNNIYAHKPDCDLPIWDTHKVHIFRLRKKLAGSGVEIVTLPRVGYYLTETEKKAA